MISLPNLKSTKSSCSTCSSGQSPSSAKCSSSVPIDPSLQGDSQALSHLRDQKGEYRNFSNVMQSEMMMKRIPSTGTIELTENCNFRCIHCYQGMNKARTRLSGEKWMSIIDELEKEGTFWLLITGGEPLLHPDFAEIYEHAYKKGLILTVFTNGRIVGPEHIELFKKYPPFAIEITLYGASEEMYQKITGTKGSFQIVRDNIQKIKAANLNLKLKSVAFHPLAQDMLQMKKYAEQEIGVLFRFDTKIDPGIYGDNFDHIRMSPEETIALEENLVGFENLASDMQKLFDYNTQKIASAGTREQLYRCGAGKNGYYIDYKGYVHTCSTGRLEAEAFDLNKKSFSEVWWVHLPKVVFQKRRDLNAVCVTCEYKAICDTCPATSQLATGSKEGRPMYICQHTMARKKRFLESKGVLTDENQKTI